MPTAGKYVLAVSGGVDSMVLLHLLQGQPGLDLIVAHFDHGIRNDSAEDRQLVSRVAAQYSLPFESKEGRLGAGASEATARAARYGFLYKLQQGSGAQAIITAHHQDDVLETAIINMVRGTGRRGLTALSSRDNVVRPLLNIPKAELQAYATEHGIEWREDSTNQDDKYLRNYVRHHVLTQFDQANREQLMEIITKLRTIDTELDSLIAEQLGCQNGSSLGRDWFIGLPHAVAREMMAAWLRQKHLRNFDKRALERLVVAAKTGRPSQRFPVTNGAYLLVKSSNLALQVPER